MAGSGKSLKRIVSWLAFLLVTFLIIGAAIKPRFSQKLIDIYQLFGGRYSDFFALALCSALFVAELGRYFNVFWDWQEIVTHRILSPTLLSPLIAAGITLSPADLTPHLHFLASVMFMLALFLRFAGSAEPDLTAAARLSSRISEYAFYLTNLTQFRHLWSYQFLLPFVLIITICRAHEIFRLRWQDYETAKRGFDRIDRPLIAGLLAVNNGIPWPQQNTHRGYPGRDGDYKKHLEESGVFKTLLNVKCQYSFLWVETSGLLVCALFLGQGLSLASVFKSGDHVYWKVLYGSLCVGIMLSVAIKCLPGLLVRLDIGLENLKSDIWQLPELILQYSWFRDMSRFITTLFSEGLPVSEIKIFSRNIDLRELEGIELGFHAIISVLARALARGCLLLLAFCLKLICVGKLISSLWGKCWPSLCNFAAILAVRDILRTKRAILGAELALDTRKLCVCQNSNNCIITKSKTELEALARQMEIDRANASADEKRGIIVGLFEINEEAMREAGSDEEIVSALGPALALVKQFYIQVFGEKYERAAATAVANNLKTYCDDAWSGYQGCITEGDWKLMKAQMLTWMLIRWLDRPLRSELDNPLCNTLAGGPLYDWIDYRRDVYTNNDCDFIAFPGPFP